MDRGFLGPLWVLRFDHEGQSLLAMGRVVELDVDAGPDTLDTLSEAAWEALEVQSKGTARCADVVFEKTSFALIDDFVEGQPLSALFRLKSSQRLLFPIDVALRIAVDALEGIAALRADTEELAPMHLHGGVGPDTLLVGTDGSTRLLNPLVSAAASSDQSFQLKPERAVYVAPEQWRGEEPDERTDVYAVGCILWEMLANRRLHVTGPSSIKKAVLEGKLPTLSPREREDLNAPLRSAVEGALSTDPFERFDSAQSFAEALRNCGVGVASAERVAEFVESLAAAHLKSQRAATENSTMAHIADILKRERPATQQPTTKKQRPATANAPKEPTKTKLPRKSAANANKTLLGIAPPVASAKKLVPSMAAAPGSASQTRAAVTSPEVGRLSAQTSAAAVRIRQAEMPLADEPRAESVLDDAPTLAPKAGMVSFGTVSATRLAPTPEGSIPPESEEEPTQNWQGKLDSSLLTHLGRAEPHVANDASTPVVEEVSQEITQRFTQPEPPARLALDATELKTEPPAPIAQERAEPFTHHRSLQPRDPFAPPLPASAAVAARAPSTTEEVLSAQTTAGSAPIAPAPAGPRPWPAVTWFFAGCTVTLAVLLLVLLLRPSPEAPATPASGAETNAVSGADSSRAQPAPLQPRPVETALGAAPSSEKPAASVHADEAQPPSDTEEAAAEANEPETAEPVDPDPTTTTAASTAAPSIAATETATTADPGAEDTPAVAAAPASRPVARPKPKKRNKSGSGFIPSDL